MNSLNTVFDNYPFVKTHHLPSELPRALRHYPKIYLVRDGRDAVVSQAFHRKNFVSDDTHILQTMCEAILASEGSYFGGWSRHSYQWIKHADLVIRFEDFVTDPEKELLRIEEKFSLTKGDYTKIPTLESQRSSELIYVGEDQIGFNSSQGLMDPNLFFRKGKIGNWKEELPSDLQQLFWSMHSHIMTQLGYFKEGGYVDRNVFLEKCNKLKNLHLPKANIVIESSKIGDKFMDGTKRYVETLIKSLQEYYWMGGHELDIYYRPTLKSRLIKIEFEKPETTEVTSDNSLETKNKAKIEVEITEFEDLEIDQTIELKDSKEDQIFELTCYKDEQTNKAKRAIFDGTQWSSLRSKIGLILFKTYRISGIRSLFFKVYHAYNYLQHVIRLIRDIVIDIFDFIRDRLIDKVKDVVIHIRDIIRDYFIDTYDILRDNIGDRVKDKVIHIRDILHDMMVDAHNVIRDNVGDKLRDVVIHIRDMLRDIMIDSSDRVRDAVVDTSDLTRNTIVNIIDQVSDEISNMIGKLYPERIRELMENRHNNKYDLIHYTLPQIMPYWRFFERRLVTVHDISHHTHAHFHMTRNVTNANRGFKLVNKIGAEIISVSKHTANDLEAKLRVGKNRTRVIYEAIDPHKFYSIYDKRILLKVLEKYGLSDTDYLFCLATNEPRKNLVNTLLAFISLIKEPEFSHIKMVVGGNPGWKNELLPESPSIINTGYLPDEDLCALNNGALGFCYVSFYEGFGLPPLEAMRCKTVAIYGNNSAMKEIIGDYGLAADPECVIDIKDKMRFLLKEVSWREQMEPKAYNHSLKYSMLNLAKEMVHVYSNK